MTSLQEATTSGTDLWSQDGQTDPSSAPGAASGTTGSSVESRGTTTVPARVVARIAEQAASEVPHIGSSAGGVLGVGARRDFDTRPSVHCDLYGRTAVLRLDVGVAFPAPLHDVLAQLRSHVERTVSTLTGLEVGRMDVEISWLNPETTRRALR
ncbi:Asp23/Gls24 family envelope stress response protein [Brachybacterium sp. ACRRE]|uniref:Asp23/Gls24 family envelope stress response protein n=1 Tax=Brachybacterium sp. ACRRE TaxID=2918184 RepID=UPI001EF3261B|nr:Asp23/Gls24 family envelope stress response protein [Brachybacterium sp. ACRRE]